MNNTNVTREDIRDAMYAAVDETIDTLWPMLGIPDHPVIARANELHDIAWPDVDRRYRDRDVWETCIRIAAYQLRQETEP